VNLFTVCFSMPQREKMVQSLEELLAHVDGDYTRFVAEQEAAPPPSPAQIPDAPQGATEISAEYVGSDNEGGEPGELVTEIEPVDY
jgi:hypothetical protein